MARTTAPEAFGDLVARLEHEDGSPLFMTLSEAAQLLSVHKRTIYRMVETGDLMGAHVGRRHLIVRRSVMDYLAGIGVDVA